MARIPHPSVRGLATIAERMARDMENHPYARQLQAEVNRLRNGADALHNVAATRSPLETPAAHALKVGNMAKKFDREITAMSNRAGQILRDGMADVRRRIDQKIDLKPDAFASEIRAAFRSLNAKDKAALINELVEQNRGPEMAAIVKAPSVLTGISDAQRAVYEKMIVTKHAPAEFDEIAKFEEVFNSAMAAQNTAAHFANSLTDPAELAQIERDAAAANAAGAAFDQSLQ